MSNLLTPADLLSPTLEVSRLVEAIIFGFASSVTLFEKYKKTRSRRKSIAAAGDVVLKTEASFEESGRLIKVEWEKDLRHLGERFGVGDEPTQSELKYHFITLQTSIIQILTPAVYNTSQTTELSIASMERLQATSLSIRLGTIRILNGMYLRMSSHQSQAKEEEDALKSHGDGESQGQFQFDMSGLFQGSSSLLSEEPSSSCEGKKRSDAVVQQVPPSAAFGSSDPLPSEKAEREPRNERYCQYAVYLQQSTTPYPPSSTASTSSSFLQACPNCKFGHHEEEGSHFQGRQQQIHQTTFPRYQRVTTTPKPRRRFFHRSGTEAKKQTAEVKRVGNWVVTGRFFMKCHLFLEVSPVSTAPPKEKLEQEENKALFACILCSSNKKEKERRDGRKVISFIDVDEFTEHIQRDHTEEEWEGEVDIERG